MKCEKSKCKQCQSEEICNIELIDSEVYCQCRHCKKIKCCCDDNKAKECYEKIKLENKNG